MDQIQLLLLGVLESRAAHEDAFTGSQGTSAGELQEELRGQG